MSDMMAAFCVLRRLDARAGARASLQLLILTIALPPRACTPVEPQRPYCPGVYQLLLPGSAAPALIMPRSLPPPTKMGDVVFPHSGSVKPHALFRRGRAALKAFHRSVLPELRLISARELGSTACVIVDVGAAQYGVLGGYDDSDSLEFLELFGGECAVHAFDLAEDQLRKLEQLALRASPARAAALHTHHLGLSNESGVRAVVGEEGRQNMWALARPGAPTTRAAPTGSGERGAPHAAVRTTTYDSWARAAGIGFVLYVKADIQGLEAELLAGMLGALRGRRVAACSFEYSYHWPAHASLDSLQRTVAALGYAVYILGAHVPSTGARGEVRSSRGPPSTSMCGAHPCVGAHTSDAFAYPVSGPYWTEAAELCAARKRHCIVDILVVQSPSAYEDAILQSLNGWRRGRVSPSSLGSVDCKP